MARPALLTVCTMDVAKKMLVCDELCCYETKFNAKPWISAELRGPAPLTRLVAGELLGEAGPANPKSSSTSPSPYFILW